MSDHCVISSANGLAATEQAYRLIEGGGDPLEAIIVGVGLVEDDPEDLTVGFGGLPNEDGVVELDAAVMHGPSHSAGAVAGVRNVRYPARLARLVMERTDHVLLVGEGAERLARSHGFPIENLLSDKARRIWLYWKQTRSAIDDWLPPPLDEIDPDVCSFFKLDQNPSPSPQPSNTWDKQDRPTGTIHCAARTGGGDLYCVTTTSGLAFKIPGRVGDTPLIGAGLYCDNDVGSCGSTGRGEACVESACSSAAVELMRQGRSPSEAGLEILQRVVDRTPVRLRDERGRPTFNLKLYLLGKTSDYAGVAIQGPATFAITDSKGPRREPCQTLF